jgi:hypothetical protein
MNTEERFRHIADISLAFTPGAPIDSRDLFAGREQQVDQVIGTIFQRGKHAVIYGERGVGKTSLANTLFDFLVLTGKFNYERARVNCADGMTFTSIWSSIFKQFVVEVDEQQYTLDQYLPAEPNSENVRETFDVLNRPTIVIIDEIDRVKNHQQTQAALADTIKTLSDNSTNTTLILVGVADTVGQLISEHSSIERAIQQVRMPRMSKSELLEIVHKGLAKCPGLIIDVPTKERIADYSQGLPYITHLLAREAALHAVRAGRRSIAMDDLDTAIREAVNSQFESLLTTYNLAVASPRGKNFKPVLLGCALASKDEHGYFYAKNVAGPLSLIAGKQYGVPAFARHLKDFCEERGPILERRGEPRRIQYRFIKPLMDPYVVLKGLADGLIAENQLSRPSATSTEPEQLSLQLSSAVPPIKI